MSLLIFYLFIDKMVRKMNRIGSGVGMRDEQGMWDANVLLYNNNDVLLVETQGSLKLLVDEFVKDEMSCA